MMLTSSAIIFTNWCKTGVYERGESLVLCGTNQKRTDHDRSRALLRAGRIIRVNPDERFRLGVEQKSYFGYFHRKRRDSKTDLFFDQKVFRRPYGAARA
ncbi:hypothetical protein D3C85_1564040 [compost metagenome]